MSNSNDTILFKQIFIILNKDVKKIENFSVNVDFLKFKEWLSTLLNKDLKSYQLSLQSSQEEKKDNRESITNQQQYGSYIKTADLKDSGTLHIFLEQVHNEKQSQSPKSQQILESCFEGEIHESYEIGQPEDNKGNEVSNTNNMLGSYSNERFKNYDASVAIIETSESNIHPSLMLSNLQSKQKSSELDAFNGQYNKKQSINYQLNLKSNDKLQSNEAINSATSNLDLNNKESLENMINYEVIRQILNKFPKLLPENIDDDFKIKQHISYFQSQNATSRRSISPQPKPNKKTDLSQSMMNTTYKCNNCKTPIENVRFHCLVCSDTDHCEKCQAEKRGEHNHPFIKYKNVPSSKQLNKSQRLFPPQTANQNNGQLIDSNLNSIAPAFQIAGKNAMSLYPAQTPNKQVPSLASSMVYYQGNQGGNFHFQNMRPPTPVQNTSSILTQTMPAQRQQQQTASYIQFGNNGLNQSQTINVPFQQYGQQQQQSHQFNQQQNQYGQQQLYRDQNVFGDIFSQQSNSQVYYQSNIPQRFDNQQKFKTYHHLVNSNQNQNTIQQQNSTNSASFGFLQDIVIEKINECKEVSADRGQTVKVNFYVKNGGKVPFPEGGRFIGTDHYNHIKKDIKQLKPGEQQEIEVQVKAPNELVTRLISFKVEFPNEKNEYVRKAIFDFSLQTK